MELLRVHNLKTFFNVDAGVVKAVNGVSFKLSEFDSLGIVGESGSGKSVTALTIMRLIETPPAEIVSGEILFENENVLKISKRRMRVIRGRKMSMIFQEPMTSLNPVFKVGRHIGEAIRLHEGVSRRESLNRAIEMLELIGIPSAGK